MKKYLVIQQIGTFSLDAKEEFDAFEDASQYASLMRKAHPNRKYCVYCRVEEAELLPFPVSKSKLRLLIRDGFIIELMFWFGNELVSHCYCVGLKSSDIETSILFNILRNISNVKLNIKHNESTTGSAHSSRHVWFV